MTNISQLLGADADRLLGFSTPKIARTSLHLPGPDFVDRVMAATDRKPMVLRNLQAIFNNGRLAGSGYVSILPVDQGIEHSAGASFAPNPLFFDPEKSSGWLSRAAATRWPPPSACWAACRASTRTGSRSS